LNLLTSAGRTGVDIGASAKLELVGEFCCLGDLLSMDAAADAAVKARIRIGWNKFSPPVHLSVTSATASILSKSPRQQM